MKKQTSKKPTKKAVPNKPVNKTTSKGPGRPISPSLEDSKMPSNNTPLDYLAQSMITAAEIANKESIEKEKADEGKRNLSDLSSFVFLKEGSDNEYEAPDDKFFDKVFHEPQPREMADHELVKGTGQDFSLPEDKMLGKSYKSIAEEVRDKYPGEDIPESVVQSLANDTRSDEISQGQPTRDAVQVAQEALYISLGKKLMEACSERNLAVEAGLELIRNAVLKEQSSGLSSHGDKTIRDIKRKKLGLGGMGNVE